AGADVVSVTRIMGADPRIGPAHLSAGLGYGGYCFPKDLQAFERLATRLGYDFPMLREVQRINDQAVEATFHKVEEVLWNLEGKRVAVLGLAFKPATDDTRFSPAVALTQRLLQAGTEVVAYDPQAAANAKAEVPALTIASDAYDALEGAHCAVIATEWPEFRDLDPERMHRAMEFPIVVDGRNLMDGAALAAAGFIYVPTGRPTVRP
ncbi:MAG: UDP binding domain-containing protein, partial [Actinomycetota bacterium]